MTRLITLVALAAPLALTLTACEDPEPRAPFAPCTDATAPFQATSASIDGDTLTVGAAYSGCDMVDLTVCWDGEFLESNPVQVHLALTGPSPGPCEAYFEHDVDIDLTPLREAYEDGYQTTSGTIVIHVDDQSATYTF